MASFSACLFALFLLASNPEVNAAVNEQKLGQPLLCHGCVAVIRELHKVLHDSSGRQKQVIQRVNNLCQVNNFVSYTFSPPKMLKACHYIIENHRKELIESLITYYRKFKTTDNLALQEEFCEHVANACEGVRRPLHEDELYGMKDIPSPFYRLNPKMKPHGMTMDEANRKLQTMAERESNLDDISVEATLEKPHQFTTPSPKEEL